MNNRSFGSWGEEQAVRYLLKQGYEIIEMNFRNMLGEIDIIAKNKDVLCFIEVKTRMSLNKGLPVDSITYYKQRKIRQLALSYLKYRYQRIDIKVRFDVVSIYQRSGQEAEIKLIRNAF